MSEIPKRPPTIDEADWIDHEHAVAKVAVEALRSLRTQLFNNPLTTQLVVGEALAKIEASGWRP